MNINELKNIISECMEELKEYNAVPGINPHQQPVEMSMQMDDNIKKQNWTELINTCVHDPQSKFLETYFMPALSAKRETIGAILDSLSENEDLQNEIYKALDEFKYQNK